MPTVKLQLGFVGLSKQLIFKAFGCGLTFISTELLGPEDVVHIGFCTVGAVNLDLIILLKSLLLANWVIESYWGLVVFYVDIISPSLYTVSAIVCCQPKTVAVAS